MLVSITESKTVDDLISFMTVVNQASPQDGVTFRGVLNQVREACLQLEQEQPLAATEIDVVRHFTNLDRQNYESFGLYPLVWFVYDEVQSQAKRLAG